MKAPFPWFGGKRQVADIVWQHFGEPGAYAEPFAGSLAVLLGRPGWEGTERWIETVNDADGFLCNAWRAILHDPWEAAHYADWPISENDLHARHMWLVEQREMLSRKLEGDPDFYDAKIAGWWVWGICCWIGGSFCGGNGPWKIQEDAEGARLLVKAGVKGEGVIRMRGVHRQIVHLGNAGQGIHRQSVRLGDRGQNNGDPGDGESGLGEWLATLALRLRHVRICCGDWSRVVTPSAQAGRKSVAVFLDPPYGAEAKRTPIIYSKDSLSIAADVRAWCMKAPESWRIALCGYDVEHRELESIGWTAHAWTNSGGYDCQADGGNRKREVIWFSPACEAAREDDQLSLREAA